tara:strand:- start:41 stop:286 length:246 start_codon:yes stop_codon:yes gene_type:complete
MKTLFQSQDRQGFLVLIDIEQSFLKEVLWNWLEEKHNDIFWDIEMHEGGSISLALENDEKRITFSGDNGIFELIECETETI